MALASLVVFPDLKSLQAAFPHIDPAVVRHDLAYPAMLTFLPVGLLGVIIASLAAAYMSTISTHLNWGSSYIVNDFYKRFVRPEASEKQLVLVGRLSTVVLMIMAAGLALLLSNALQAFNILLQIGAGTGLLFILRWFWWRINAWCEITALVVSFVIAIYFQFVHGALGLSILSTHIQLVLGVGITTLSWIIVSLFSKPTDTKTLRNFYRLIGPGGPGWRSVIEKARKDGDPISREERPWNVPLGILCMVLGCVAVYSALFATGMWLYGNTGAASVLSVVSVATTLVLVRMWRRLTATWGKETR